MHIKGSECENELEPGSIADARDRDFFDSDSKDELDPSDLHQRYLIIQMLWTN
jgi:hypothetical protein